MGDGGVVGESQMERSTNATTALWCSPVQKLHETNGDDPVGALDDGGWRGRKADCY